MSLKLLVFGCKSFNNTLEEIKVNLGYSLLFFDFHKPSFTDSDSIAGVIVDSEICKHKDNLDIINKFNKKPIILLQDFRAINFNYFNNILVLPITLLELTSKINNILASTIFISNSSIKIKDYLLNKNEKRLVKLNLSISITEKEVKLIELLFKERKPLPAKLILKKIWNYADDADTHTVETHIYRLKKKINNKFKDNSFILNSNKGYLI